MKGLKHISVLLLVNIFILIGHNLVPHHHHVAEISPPSSHECPEGNHDHKDKDSGSAHCHAFNNIDFVNYNHSQVPVPVGMSTFVIFKDPGQIPGPHAGKTTAPHLYQKLAALSAEGSGNHSLRGPPVLS